MIDLAQLPIFPCNLAKEPLSVARFQISASWCEVEGLAACQAPRLAQRAGLTFGDRQSGP